MHLHADTRRLPGIPGARHTRWAVRLAAATVAGLAMLATGLAALPAGAAGTTLYVDRSASCPGLGLQAAPYCTIGAAAAAATAGTTVRVAAGTYPETVTPARSGASGSPIVYDADPGATVRGGTNGFTVASRSWVTVRGFTVADIEAVIDLYLAGEISTDHLTAAVRPLEEANEALEDLRAGRVMRSVLVP